MVFLVKTTARFPSSCKQVFRNMYLVLTRGLILLLIKATEMVITDASRS